MTTVDQYTSLAPELTVDPSSALAFDIYRNVHKGIRAELFAATASAGSTDPGDREARVALTAHILDVVEMLVEHGHHEDRHILPALETQVPALFDRNAGDHATLDARLGRIADRAGEMTEAAPDQQRARLHNLYLDLGSFTSAYLAHQEFEERIVMPALLDTIGVESAFEIHHAIVSSIPPPTMAKALAVMMPAMNVDDRCEMLRGMEHDAPPEAFDAVWGLTRSALSVADFRALAARLGKN